MAENNNEETLVRNLRRRMGKWEVRVVGIDGDHVAVDISEGGMFMAGTPQLMPGEMCRAIVQLPDGPLEVSCLVKWRRSVALSPAVREGMGVEFLRLSEEQIDRLATLVES